MKLDKIVDPILLFKNWLSEAEKNEIRDPNAMQLATVFSLQQAARSKMRAGPLSWMPDKSAHRSARAWGCVD